VERNIEHYLFHKKNFLSEEFCKKSIDMLESSEWKTHGYYDRNGNSFEYPSSGGDDPDMLSDPHPYLNEHIIKLIRPALHEYIDGLEFKWFGGWAGYSAIKFIRYSVNHKMYEHCDHAHDLFDGERKGVPVLSLIGVLNDDYEGGEFIMFGDKQIELDGGDLIVYPSTFLYPHRVEPITKGVRYSYVSWTW
jgi:hypothetical protein